MRLLPLLIALPLLAGCDVDTASEKSSTVSVGDAVSAKSDGTTATAAASGAAGHGINIDTDGFKASLDIPGMSLGGKNFDISGMKLYPGSEVRGMKVVSRKTDGSEKGIVTISFDSPGAPEAVLVHAMAEAKANDWTVTRAGNTINGTGKDGDTMAYSAVPAGSGSKGTIVLTDTK